MDNGFKTVWLLALANAVAMSGTPMMMLIGAIIGTELAPSARWATLPIALMVIGTALGVIPAARGMARLGRKWTFLIFLLIGIGACAVASTALYQQSFSLFCLGALILGVTNAALQQARFAAMECVPLEKGPTAASIIMCAGIVAAFLGPELALLGQNLTSVPYAGSFMLAIGCFVCAGLLLSFYRPPRQFAHQHQGEARPWTAMLANPALILAVASGAIAYVVMSFIMTATPISMHVHHGHSLEDTKWVIQSHIAAMFLPSLLTAWLFKALSIRGLMAMGLVCYGAMIVIGLFDVSVLGFWGQLVLLGVGWNFLFVAGTALLPTTYREGEQYRAQALNDSVVFSIQAAASLSAGLAITLLSWQSLLLLCLVPIGVMLVALASYRRPI
ncbi:MFS transporter [Halioglobus maricola]|uniref:MFS transporter n=1 Tax=Halioglobus maricola TaxID=2601894 RepID=A0A5P9NHB0_9GAMM|nr:MFS transporter [Halioglobus maricola]QFU75210.1 MFS transporter [Halioglobus maricola]